MNLVANQYSLPEVSIIKIIIDNLIEMTKHHQNNKRKMQKSYTGQVKIGKKTKGMENLLNKYYIDKQASWVILEGLGENGGNLVSMTS